MKTLKLFRAQPIGIAVEENPVSVTIVIDEEITEEHYQGASLEECRKIFDTQADALVDALYHSLPQGTFDRVALKMFEKKLSLYVGVTNS
jgi:hypothetical protein